MDLTSGDTTRISPGMGKTTCAFFRPGSDEILFASTHHDPKSKQYQDDELAFRASGKERRYAWDYDPEMEIYAYQEGTKALTRLTSVKGYDAEAGYSPDGQWIVFSSTRQAYDHALTPAETKQLATDPSWFAEIYVMKADGSGQRRLTTTPGYDGGPFFTPDGKKILWRRFDEQGLIADVWTMNPDGTDAKQITDFKSMSWAPYMHASGEYILFASNKLGFENFEVYMVDAAGHQRAGARHLHRRLRRPAGALARRHTDRLHVGTIGRRRWPDLPGAVESPGGDEGPGGRAAAQELRTP